MFQPIKVHLVITTFAELTDLCARLTADPASVNDAINNVGNTEFEASDASDALRDILIRYHG
jgi:hypothetical protein